MIGTGMPRFVSKSIGFVLHVYQYDVETYISICVRNDYRRYEQIL